MIYIRYQNNMTYTTFFGVYNRSGYKSEHTLYRITRPLTHYRQSAILLTTRFLARDFGLVLI